eukprot:gene6016-6088_t
MSETVLATRPIMRFDPGVLTSAPAYGGEVGSVLRAELRPIFRKAPVEDGLAPHHRWRAGARLRVGLLAWAQPGVADLAGDGATVELLTCEVTRSRLIAAAKQAARCVGLSDAEAVMRTLDRVSVQNAAVEGIREGLLEAAKALVRLLAACRGGDAATQNRVRCCGLLMAPILGDLGKRLAMADALSASVIDVLSDPDTCIETVQACCDGVSRRYQGLSDMLARCISVAPFSVSERDHAFLVALSMRQTQPA